MRRSYLAVLFALPMLTLGCSKEDAHGAADKLEGAAKETADAVKAGGEKAADAIKDAAEEVKHESGSGSGDGSGSGGAKGGGEKHD